jgi:hypothetical protein
VIDLSDAPRAFDVPGGAGFLSPGADNPGLDYLALQHVRVLAHARRIAAETGGREAVARSTRGTKRVVVCLTSLDPETGRLRRFAAVSRAAEWLGRVSDNVCQAIKRKGLCGGHRWAYESDLPRDFDELGAVADLGVRSPLASAA